MSADWQVGVVAETVTGEVLLKMTEAQAESLRVSLTWLLSDGEADR